MIEVFGEDVTAWQDQRGFFHMLMQGGPYTDTASPWLRQCDGHYHLAHSKDGLDWVMHCHAAPVAGNSFTSFPLTNGSSVRVKRRERHYVLLGYGNFDIILDQFSRISQLRPTQHALCAILYLVTMPIRG